jgi:hypothetical protein
MITVEVLVSMLILFMVVASSVTALKQLRIVRTQQTRHEALYTEVLNVQDMLSKEICNPVMRTRGELDGYTFEAHCTQFEALRSYKKDLEENIDGNVGHILVQLFEVTLLLRRKHIEKEYTYLKTVTKPL